MIRSDFIPGVRTGILTLSFAIRRFINQSTVIALKSWLLHDHIFCLLSPKNCFTIFTLRIQDWSWSSGERYRYC